MSAPTADRKATGVFSPSRAQIPQRTLRTDRWWQSPLIVGSGLRRVRHLRDGAGVPAEQLLRRRIQLPDAVLLAVHSKGCIPEASHFWPQIIPDVWWIPFAAFSLPFLLLFRLTCYYYRGAYYRSVWQSPTACAVAEPHAKYTGETRFPLIIQNRTGTSSTSPGSSRSSTPTTRSWRSTPTRAGGFGFGLGNVILVVNV